MNRLFFISVSFCSHLKLYFQAASFLGKLTQELVRFRNQLSEELIRDRQKLEHGKTSFTSKMIKRRIKTLENDIKKVEVEMARIVASDEDLSELVKLLTGVSGVGFKTACMMLADISELGSLGRRQISALIGVAPFAQDSGLHKGRRIIQGGRKNPRNKLYMAALVASQHNDVLREFYQRLLKNGKLKKVALVAVMRKLIIHLNSLVKRYFEEKGGLNSSFS